MEEMQNETSGKTLNYQTQPNEHFVEENKWQQKQEDIFVISELIRHLMLATYQCRTLSL
nr:MAG TPA: hypothetical protein [Caudoviricetes sp.]